MKVRKKPVVVDAVQWTGDNLTEICDILLEKDEDRLSFNVEKKELSIKTLEGTMKANLNDWIIKGIKGELYPCKPDIFEASYEIVI
jgi:hypothetical protein